MLAPLLRRRLLVLERLGARLRGRRPRAAPSRGRQAADRSTTMSRVSSFFSRSSATSRSSALLDVGFRQPHVEAVLAAAGSSAARRPGSTARTCSRIVGIAIEQREEVLGARLGAAADHQRQPHQRAASTIGLEHGAVVGDDGDAAVLLPEREGLALGDGDLQLAGIELEHGRVGDPGIGLEPLARRLDIEEQQRGACR